MYFALHINSCMLWSHNDSIYSWKQNRSVQKKRKKKDAHSQQFHLVPLQKVPGYRTINRLSRVELERKSEVNVQKYVNPEKRRYSTTYMKPLNALKTSFCVSQIHVHAVHIIIRLYSPLLQRRCFQPSFFLECVEVSIYNHDQTRITQMIQIEKETYDFISGTEIVLACFIKQCAYYSIFAR